MGNQWARYFFVYDVMAWVLSITAIIVLAVTVIVLLPILLRRRFNRILGGLDDFTGQAARVGVNLFASRVNVYDVRLDSRRTPGQEPVVFIPHIVIDFKWSALFRRMRDLTIRVNEPRVVMVEDKNPETPATSGKEPANLKTLLEKLPAFYADIEVRDGSFQYIGTVADVQTDVPITALYFSIHGLTNRSIPKHISPIEATATVYEGHAILHANLLPLADTLTFAVTLELQGVNLVMLNNFLRRYARVDVSYGKLDVYAELGVASGVFKGYLKPIFKNLDFAGTSDQRDGFFQKVWERSVALGLKLLENHRKGEIATKIPFQGTLENPNVSVGAALVGILKNAFIRSVKPSLDNAISARTLWKSARAVTGNLLQSYLDKRRNA
jgi:hypothetical protein